MPPGGGEKPAPLFYKRRIMEKGGGFCSVVNVMRVRNVGKW